MITVTSGNTAQAIADIKAEMEKALGNLPFITVGIHEDKSQRDDSKLSNAQIGAINHFGTDKIPARPWLDVGVKSGSALYEKEIKDAIEKGDRDSIGLALERVGVLAVASVQTYIKELSSPPNAASTIKRKGSSSPLIDTGQMRQSITYQIVTDKPSEGL